MKKDRQHVLIYLCWKKKLKIKTKFVHYAQISKKSPGSGSTIQIFGSYSLQYAFIKFTKMAFQPQMFDKRSTKHCVGCVIFDALYSYLIYFGVIQMPMEDPNAHGQIKFSILIERPTVSRIRTHSIFISFGSSQLWWNRNKSIPVLMYENTEKN